jgi:hypothetical protein
LSSLLVGDHLVLEANEDFLHGVVSIPVFEHVELGWLNNTIALVDAWDVDFGVELNLAWYSWVVITTCDLHHVDSVVKVGVLRTNNGAIPVCERLIVT